VWVYSGKFAGRSFRMHVDYGGRGDQLRYEVSLDDVSTGIQPALDYEALIGFGQGQWDYVTR